MDKGGKQGMGAESRSEDDDEEEEDIPDMDDIPDGADFEVEDNLVEETVKSCIQTPVEEGRVDPSASAVQEVPAVHSTDCNPWSHENVSTGNCSI